ncbi:hypothetical protein [Kitasatospora sp. GAS1066B]|uniref:hypothetical protein n=1 Tax=Kitasatospora sp. GAS1066B TaxID=3156271 RepID=UPI003514827D
MVEHLILQWFARASDPGAEWCGWQYGGDRRMRVARTGSRLQGAPTVCCQRSPVMTIDQFDVASSFQ